MTKLLKGLYLVGVAAVLAVSAAPTQAADLKCTVPFEFIVNNRALPAGTYDVSISGGVLMVRGSKDGAFVLANRAESARAAECAQVSASSVPATGTATVRW